MINIVHFIYTPNAATTNRLLSYIFNFPSHIKVRVYFMMPDKKRSKIEKKVPSNVEIIYCWDKYDTSVKLLKYVVFNRVIRFIRHQLREGDVVYCYNIPLYINRLVVSGVKYFGEITEHPEVVKQESRLIKFNIKDHIDLCRRLDGIFVISTALKKYYVENGIDENKIHIINMTVDINRFVNIYKTTARHKYIAYCGSATNYKDGVDKLIHSFSIINRKYPEYYLYIIGRTSYEIEISNLKYAEDLGIHDKVVFMGEVSSDDIPQILVNAEMLVLNRPDNIQNKYGFATKIGEYLLTKNPVVLTKVGDIPLFLTDFSSALLSSPDDDNEFADKMLWIIENPVEAKTIGSNGSDVAKRYFNAEIETSKLINHMLK